MIRPVIVSAERQLPKAERLALHCLNLDGTRIRIIRITEKMDSEFESSLPAGMHPEQKFSCRQAFSLHQASLAMNGRPFLWLEPDSIPLREGWSELLEDEYLRLGKPFMLSSDSNPPHDLVGGIGIYDGDCHRIIPDRYERNGFDLWLVEKLGHAVSRTSLIQHSYGFYRKNGTSKPHRFPRDSRIIRKDAVIFHRDRHQELIP